jgi:hypothetical protein
VPAVAFAPLNEADEWHPMQLSVAKIGVESTVVSLLFGAAALTHGAGGHCTPFGNSSFQQAVDVGPWN